MEQQLAAVNWKPDDFENRIHELEIIRNQKDGQIRELQSQLEDQVSLTSKPFPTYSKTAADKF